MRPLVYQKIPMEDGVHLATDVFFPEGPGPFPVVLARTPYHRVSKQGFAPSFTSRGYAFVIQDCRGKFDSEGEFTPLVDEARDGRATLDWVANEPWCNGRIGMWGRSYGGIVQVPAASGGHEALRCIAPSIAPGSFFRHWARYYGCFAVGNLIRWALTHASSPTNPPIEHFDWEELWALADPEAIAARVGFRTPVLSVWAEHDSDDAYWKAIDQSSMHEHIRVPGMHSGGWFDHLTIGQFEAYANIRDGGATEEARQGQRLLVGPWGHMTVNGDHPERTRYGDWAFGPDAELPVLEHELQFFDFHLQDRDDGFMAQPPVKVFLIGEDRWVYLDDWPPPGVEERACYLTSTGSAGVGTGSGELAWETPGRSASDAYSYDPADPVPTVGGPIYWGLELRGPRDQRSILGRPDVLYYRGPELAAPLTVMGEMSLDLFVSSDAQDTDFVAKVCVEEQSGAVTCLTVGSLRCRYRNSTEVPEPLVPGDVTRISLHAGHLAYTFPQGSRVGLVLTSSDFPRILPHPNTMARPWAKTDPVVARNSVHHGPGAFSCLRLPVVEL